MALATTNEQGQAIFTATTTVAATYTLTAKVEQANGQVSTKTAESKFVADDKNAVLAASSDVQFSGGGWETTATADGYPDVGKQPRWRGICGSTLRLRKG